MSWKKSFRPIYADGTPEPAAIDLAWKETAQCVIGVRTTCLARARRQLPTAQASTQLVPQITPTEPASGLSGRSTGCAGILTGRCAPSTVRSLADESYNVIAIEDCYAAGLGWDPAGKGGCQIGTLESQAIARHQP